MPASEAISPSTGTSPTMLPSAAVSFMTLSTAPPSTIWESTPVAIASASSSPFVILRSKRWQDPACATTWRSAGVDGAWASGAGAGAGRIDPTAEATNPGTSSTSRTADSGSIWAMTASSRAVCSWSRSLVASRLSRSPSLPSSTYEPTIHTSSSSPSSWSGSLAITSSKLDPAARARWSRASRNPATAWSHAPGAAGRPVSDNGSSASSSPWVSCSTTGPPAPGDPGCRGTTVYGSSPP